MISRHVTAAWGLLGVSVILVVAVVRLLPLALEPVYAGMSASIAALYLFSVVFMAWSEGYKGFQKAFSPRVVKRAYWLAEKPSPGLVLIAPIFVMGLVHATRKRLIASWILVIAITVLVWMVRHLDQPWRGAVDAGVVVGLTWGVLSIWILWYRAVLGSVPDIPADVPTT